MQLSYYNRINKDIKAQTETVEQSLSGLSNQNGMRKRIRMLAEQKLRGSEDMWDGCQYQ
jgi:hypothetical protein